MVHKMHHTIENGNLILSIGRTYMHETNLSTVATMGIDQGAVRQFKEQGAPLSHLPKSVRFLGEVPAEMDCKPQQSAGMCQFEVVKGNAAYREGERFYLTPAQAQRIYL
jgi:hypothetical protein